MDQFRFQVPATATDSASQRPTPRLSGPPLWLLLESAAGAEDPPACLRRKSCSAAEDAADDGEGLGLDTYSKATGGGRFFGSARVGSISPARSDDDGLREEILRNEDRMDRMWESYNEELRRISCDKSRSIKQVSTDSARSKGGAMQVRYAGDRGGAAAVTRRRIRVGDPAGGETTPEQNTSQSLQAMLKLLKRMVLVQKSKSIRKSNSTSRGSRGSSHTKIRFIEEKTRSRSYV